MANLSPETVQPAVSPEAADASKAEKATAVVDSQAVAAPASAERLPSSQPTDTASPAGETAERIAASAGPERLPSSKPADTASPAGETAEIIAALEQPAGIEPLPAAPVAEDPQLPLPLSPPLEANAPNEALSPLSPSQSSGRPADGFEPERVQPAASPSDAPTEAVAVLSVQPETASPFKPSDTAPAFESLQPIARPQGAGTETATALASQPEVGHFRRAVGGNGDRARAGSAGAGRPAARVRGGSRRRASQSQPEAAQPVERPVETALLVPARPGSILGTEVDKPSDRYRRIVDFIRQYSAGDCFIALPAMNLDGDVTFQTFGRDKAREEQFREALSGLDDLRAEISTGDVADSQCLALSFARSAKRYPGFSLMIDLDEAEIASGTRLSGSVLNADDRELHLLLVDDEGQVQSIDKFLAAGDGTDRTFETPLSLTGGPVVTKQILLAITTDPSLPILAEPVNEPANAFFAQARPGNRGNRRRYRSGGRRVQRSLIARTANVTGSFGNRRNPRRYCRPSPRPGEPVWETARRRGRDPCLLARRARTGWSGR